jgi:hypothetical protein
VQEEGAAEEGAEGGKKSVSLYAGQRARRRRRRRCVLKGGAREF